MVQEIQRLRELSRLTDRASLSAGAPGTGRAWRFSPVRCVSDPGPGAGGEIRGRVERLDKRQCRTTMTQVLAVASVPMVQRSRRPLQSPIEAKSAIRTILSARIVSPMALAGG
jgi:hypothetical protein